MRRILENRQRLRTARPRTAAYAAASELLASPHDVDVVAALRARDALAPFLAAAAPLEEIARTIAATPRGALRDAYAALFEVGDEGPPVPIREDLLDDRGAGIREEVVRFYDHFDYRLAERFAWQPAHLSVQLEFVQLLCHRESAAVDDAGAKPYQLAQLDFAARHLVSWVPRVAHAAQGVAAGSLYASALAALDRFLDADLAWQRSTIGGQAEPADGRA